MSLHRKAFLKKGFLLVIVILVSVQVERQPRHHLHQNTDTGIHGGHVHGGTLRHRFARGDASEVETVCSATGAVLMSVQRTEQVVEKTIPMEITLLH